MNWFWNRRIGKKDYLMSKALFIFLSIFIMTIFTWAIIATQGSDTRYPYLYCPTSHAGQSWNYTGPDGAAYSVNQAKCKNPLYQSPDCGTIIPSDSEICTTEYLASGTSLGTPPPFIYKYFWDFTLGGIFLFLLVNHLLFNRSFFKEDNGGKV